MIMVTARGVRSGPILKVTMYNSTNVFAGNFAALYLRNYNRYQSETSCIPTPHERSMNTWNRKVKCLKAFGPRQLDSLLLRQITERQMVAQY